MAVPPADTAAPPGLPLLLDAAKPGEEWRRGEEEGGRWREEGLEVEVERVEEEVVVVEERGGGTGRGDSFKNVLLCLPKPNIMTT